jgi:hypothetical protein
MNRRHLLSRLATLAALPAVVGCVAPALAQSAPARAQPAQTLSFEAHQGGQHTQLQLRLDAGQASGSFAEGELRLQLQGQLQGRRLQGQLFMAGVPQPVGTVDGELQADQLDLTVRAAGAAQSARLLMRRVGAAAPAAATASAAAGTLDPQLFGAWQQQTHTNSGGGAGGFASFTTVRRLLVGADGRVQQTLRSVGGGGNWSHSSGEEVEFSGRWAVRHGEIWVLPDGQSAYVSAGRYRLVDGRLVIDTGNGRKIWSR